MMFNCNFNFNLSFNLPSLQLKWDHLIPAPAALYSSAGSILAAASIGGIYGLFGRVMYPKAGISPLNYAIWFVVAYQIKQLLILLELHFDNFVKAEQYAEELERLPEDEVDVHNHFRYYCWKILHLKNEGINQIDQLFSRIFNIRTSKEITPENVYKASFLEMCRYRVWRIFKSTILNKVSFSFAHKLSNAMGFTLPSQTSIQLFIVIQSIVKDILVVPALYSYAKLCNRLVEKLGEGGEVAAAYRAFWIQRFLPAL